MSSYVAQSWDVQRASTRRDPVISFLQKLRRPIIVALGNPYFLQQIPWTQSYVVGWGGFPVSQQAAARVILGLAARDRETVKLISILSLRVVRSRVNPLI